MKTDIHLSRFISSLKLVVFAWLVLLGQLVLADRPNIVFVLTDDQSYGMMGCDGNQLTQTPNLDRMAKDGIFFERAYVTSAICTPSRISIFLSQFERKHGVNFNSGTSVAPEAWAKSYPVLLREAGYYTGYIGKNHAPLGQGGYDSQLMEKSFDYFYAGHGHIKFYPKEAHDIFHAAKEDTQAEIITEAVGDFLSNQHRLDGALHFLETRPEKPFCLSVCFNLPHGAGTSTMQMRDSDDAIYRTLYRDIKIPLPNHYLAKSEIQKPKIPADILKVEDRQVGYSYVDHPDTLKERMIRQMQAMTGIDRMVGKLREKLASEGLAENTILVFCSDHGLFMGQFGLGGKALCYEQTTHVPLMIVDPRLPLKSRGKRCRQLVQTIDIAPTLLDVAGVAAPECFQGKSLVPLLNDCETTVREYVFTENLWSTHFGNPRIESVQDLRWKYIRYYQNDNFSATEKIRIAKQLGISVNKMLYAFHDDSIATYRHYVESSLRGESPIYEELFDIESDPAEANNLIGSSELKDTLDRLRLAWKRELAIARGEGVPKVLRYTADSKLESELRKLKKQQKKSAAK
ncbi:MAG: sulfatase-like hydrolase/transferase [Planctomycetota bacterium]